MDFWHNPFWKGMGTTMKAIPNGVYKLGENAAKGVLLYAGGAALGGAIGGAASSGTGAGAGEGGYTVLEGMPPLGDGVEGGAMDMYGSQSSPTDASNIFEPTASPKSLGGRQEVMQQLMKNRMPGMSQPYRYQQPPRQQPNFLFPSPIVSVMPKDTYGSY